MGIGKCVGMWGSSVPSRAGVLNLFCLVYPLPKDRSVIYPHGTTTAFSLPKISL